jgi:septum site-determining protein MinC
MNHSKDNDTMIQIKGIREGLLITAHSGSWEERKKEILARVQEKAAFFDGARVCLDVGDTLVRVKELTQLREKLIDAGVVLWAVLTTSEITGNNARTLGFETALPVKKEKQVGNERPDDTAEKAVYISKTLRAGYRVEAREHVIVFGDVNPGAEIVSAGSIFVWGKLKGSAIAGVEGDSKAVICALELKPTQIRIAERNFPPVTRKGKSNPEMAFMHENVCKIEIWNNEKGK